MTPAECESQLTHAAGEAVTCLYTVARSTGDYEALTARARRLLEVEAGQPWVSFTLANLLTDQGEVDEAIPLYEAAIRGFDGAGDHRGRVLGRLNLVTYRADQRRWDECGALLDEAAALVGDDAALSARVRAQRARVAWRSGLGEGEALRDVRALLQELGDGGEYQTRLIALNTATGITFDAGLDSQAEVWLDQMEAHATADPYVLATVASLRLHAALDRPVTDPARLAMLGEAAAAAGGAGGNPFAEIDGRCTVAWSREWPASAPDWARCIERADADGDPEQGTEWRLAQVARIGADPLGDQLLAEAAGITDRWALDTWRPAALAERAVRAQDGGRPDEAWAATTGLLDHLAALAVSPDAHSRSALLRYQANLLYRPAEWWARTPEGVDRSLQITETLRGARLDATALAARARPPTPEQARLQRELDRALEELWDVPDDARPALLARIDGLRTELRSSAGGEQRPLPTVAAIQAALRPDEALVAFQLPDAPGLARDLPPAWALVVTPRSATRVDVPGRLTLEPRVSMLLGAVRSRTDTPDLRAALAEDLLERVWTALPPDADHLLVLPDGPLHAAPLGLLRADDGREVAVVPSAHHLLGLRASDPVAPGRVVVVAADAVAGLPPLEGARAEVDAVTRAFADVDVRQGDQATEEALVAALTTPGITLVHVAAHAEVDPVFPERTRIRLASGDGGDGVLTVAELARLKVPGTIVVLSACETAQSLELAGEGPLGLGRALLDAGARAVVATTWPMRDDEAAAFVGVAMDELGAGAELGTAVERARRVGLASGAPSEGWAGVVVLGDPRVRPARVAPPTRWWPWGLALASAGLAALLRWRRLAR
jgi:hypothetical protein